MSIAKPFTFVANTHAKSSEVNANFDTVYSQVNSNISAIAQNATDIENLENNKADINGSSAQRFAVADAITDTDAINKRSLRNAIGNSMDYISGFTITKDSGSPNDTIIVSEGSCYDSTKATVLSKNLATTKQNTNQAANATYYVYVIGNAASSSVDILISTESIAPSLPTGYSLYRQIGKYTTNASNQINYIFNHDSSYPDAKAVIIKTYVNGTSWYRVWSDKFVEQGGLSSSSMTVSLLMAYADTNYTISVNSKGPRGGNSDYQVQPYPDSVSQFSIGGQQSGHGCYWVTRGYIS